MFKTNASLFSPSSIFSVVLLLTHSTYAQEERQVSSNLYTAEELTACQQEQKGLNTDIQKLLKEASPTKIEVLQSTRRLFNTISCSSRITQDTVYTFAR